MKPMSNLKNIFCYWRQYGTYSLLGHAWELRIVNPYRFRLGCQRNVPIFPERAFLQQNLKQNIEERSLKQIKLKICYLIHYFYPEKRGGTERFVLNVAKQQQCLEHNVLVITLGNLSLSKYDRKLNGIYYREYVYEGVPVLEIRHERAPLGLYYKDIHDDDYFLKSFATTLLEKEKIDVVHVAYPQPFYNFVLAACEKNVPVILTGTDFNLFCHYATMVDRKGQFCSGAMQGKRCKSVCKTYGCQDLEKRFQKAITYIHTIQVVTVPSEFVARVFVQEFPDISIQVIPHGIDEKFKSQRERHQTKRFVYAGTLSELKGVHLLIAAFEKIVDDVQLDIYGGTSSSYAQRLMQTKDMRIQFHGAVEASKMVDIYQQADCVVVPSIWYETYNFVVREALACGCLVIASDIGAMPEAILEEHNGFLFQAGSQDDLEKALKKAIQFDWRYYEQAFFPSLQEEGRSYNQFYHSLINGEGYQYARN